MTTRAAISISRLSLTQGSDTYRNYIGLTWYLEELLGGRRVDLVTTRVLEGYLHSDVTADHAEKNRDRVYISRMIEEMAFLLHRKKNLGFREFSHDELMKRAAIRSLEIIGDGASRTSETIKKAYPGIPWRELAGMKDRIAGMYFSPDWVLVWDILEAEIPAAEPRLRSLVSFALKSVRQHRIRAGKKRLSLPSHSFQGLYADSNQ